MGRGSELSDINTKVFNFKVVRILEGGTESMPPIFNWSRNPVQVDVPRSLSRHMKRPRRDRTTVNPAANTWYLHECSTEVVPNPCLGKIRFVRSRCIATWVVDCYLNCPECSPLAHLALLHECFSGSGSTGFSTPAALKNQSTIKLRRLATPIVRAEYYTYGGLFSTDLAIPLNTSNRMNF